VEATNGAQMRYDLVAFDFDGTLADTVPWFASMMDNVANKYNFRTVGPQERERLRDCDSREVVRALGIPLWKMPVVLRHLRDLMEQASPDVRLFDGIGRALHELRRAGVMLAVVSSNSVGNVRRVLGRDVAATIDFYECGVSMFGKSGTLERLLKLSRVDRRRMILIGDEIRDIDAAKSAGIHSGAVAWGYNRIGSLRKRQPDEVFLQVDDILSTLLRPSKSPRD
jgi:phosphoglycolate phosphatase